MLPLRYSTAVICAVFIATEAVSEPVPKPVLKIEKIEVNPDVLYLKCKDEIKAVGDKVSFRPTNMNPPVTSIIWKHKSSSGIVVKAIEWDDDGFNIPNQRFKGITTLDEKTGQITITDITVEHSGLYTIDIDTKEQEQRFNLEVMEPVPKPVIKIEKIKVNPDVLYLKCKDEIKAVGDKVSFRPTNMNPPVTSIIWKHKSSSGIVVKAIEWDDDGFNIPNQRFKGITTLDEKTGQITITDITVEHSGLYTIDINAKEQEQRFNLKVMERVPKPVIEIEKIEVNPDVV